MREPSILPSVDLARLSADLVAGKRASLLWNAYIERHHYLGHQLMPGAQLRYFVHCADTVVACISFGASAWKTQPCDAAIGWSIEQRRRNLHLIVNNARFLILPWIHCKNLASRLLALVSRRLADDWHARYSYRPVLLETFVEKPRFLGTCYKAANSTRCIVTANPSKACGSIHSCPTTAASSALDRSNLRSRTIPWPVSLKTSV
ncbi:MAG: Druantia anti-phage system protein DruA [Steroidobacteraceae bacterium]